MHFSEKEIALRDEIVSFLHSDLLYRLCKTLMLNVPNGYLPGLGIEMASNESWMAFLLARPNSKAKELLLSWVLFLKANVMLTYCPLHQPSRCSPDFSFGPQTLTQGSKRWRTDVSERCGPVSNFLVGIG